MTKKLTDDIVEALLDAFPSAKVYTEQVKQGLREPCFLVRCLNETNMTMLGTRYRRMYLFSVQYMPQDSENARGECYDVRDALFQTLEYIGAEGDQARGTGMSGEVFEDVLTFTVSYTVFVRSVFEKETMGTLEIENHAR
jgi:hypothetical protein